MVPAYRSAAAFERQDDYVIDALGLRQPGAQLQSVHPNWEPADPASGSLPEIPVQMDGPTGTDRMEREAQSWALSFCKHARAMHCLNHDHICTATCTKYAKDDGNSQQQQVAPKFMSAGSFSSQCCSFGCLRAGKRRCIQ